MANKKNYNKISTERAKAEVVSEVEEVSMVEAEPVEEVVRPNPIGSVCNCEKLNVRSKANVNSDVVCVINKGSEVEIDESKSTKDFYAVTVSNIVKKTSVSGFCMKKYITVKK